MNHFIEVAQNPDDLEHIWLVIHTGSRNLGIKVWKYWRNIAKSPEKIDIQAIKSEEKKIREKYKGDGKKIEKEIKALKKLGKFVIPPSQFLTSPIDIQGYLSDSCVLGAWAEYNHFLISQRIFEQDKSLGWKKEVDRIRSVHNYIDPQDRIIRKGSVRSYVGEKLVIPISMSFGTIIGEGRSNPDRNFTAPHGAGRVLSRGKAKKEVSMEEFKKSMKGIVSTSVVPECLDESPMAYKDPEVIMKEVVGNTIEVKEIIKPLLSVKDKGR